MRWTQISGHRYQGPSVVWASNVTLRICLFLFCSQRVRRSEAARSSLSSDGRPSPGKHQVKVLLKPDCGRKLILSSKMQIYLKLKRPATRMCLNADGHQSQDRQSELNQGLPHTSTGQHHFSRVDNAGE